MTLAMTTNMVDQIMHWNSVPSSSMMSDDEPEVTKLPPPLASVYIMLRSLENTRLCQKLQVDTSVYHDISKYRVLVEIRSTDRYGYHA
jgi:hypothetical protein